MTAGFSWHEKRGLPFFIAKTWFGRYHSDNYNLTKKSWRMPRHVSSIYQVSPPLCRNETYLFFFAKPLYCWRTTHPLCTLSDHIQHTWSKCQGHSFKLFSYQMYMIFLLALLPDRNTSPIVGQTYTMEWTVFCKLDAKILSLKSLSLLLVS